MTLRPEDALNAVLAWALTDSRRARDYLDRGQEIPDKLLPGRAVMRAPKEVREALGKLTSDHLDIRPDIVKPWL